MFQYIMRRVLQFIPVFLGVTLMLFLIANYLPGADAVQMRVGEKAMDPKIKARIIHQLGLDQPWYVQYGDYLSGLSMVHVVYYDGSPVTGDGSLRIMDGTVALVIPRVPGTAPAAGPVKIEPREDIFYMRGASGRMALGPLSLEFDPIDLGVSLYNGRPVMNILYDAYPYTIILALAAIFLEIVFGVGAGIISATRRYSASDVFVTLSTSVLVSVPVFWLGIMLQYVFGTWLKGITNGAIYLPPVFSGGSSAEFGPLAYLILPAITLAAVSTAYAARIMRSQLLEVNGQDYIRTAFAKGLSARKVLWSHSIKNALIPDVTFIGLDFGAMLAGAILTETVFNWPGVGWTIYRAIIGRDFPIVFGGVTLILFIVMFVNLAVDISYAFLDPRIRYGGTEE
ncbi:MAG: ABC transporter permease [Coriobacteriia bacterium]|nr:ABC transporter permease [Coriobacteriia bacterium]